MLSVGDDGFGRTDWSQSQSDRRNWGPLPPPIDLDYELQGIVEFFQDPVWEQSLNVGTRHVGGVIDPVQQDVRNVYLPLSGRLISTIYLRTYRWPRRPYDPEYPSDSIDVYYYLRSDGVPVVMAVVFDADERTWQSVFRGTMYPRQLYLDPRMRDLETGGALVAVAFLIPGMPNTDTASFPRLAAMARNYYHNEQLAVVFFQDSTRAPRVYIYDASARDSLQLRSVPYTVDNVTIVSE